MIKQPYPYQEELIKETSRSLREHQAVIVQAPTGAGKTIIMLNMIHRGLQKGNTFLVISETRKIYRQLVNEFSGIEINANVKSLYIQTGRCYVAMAQTLKRRPVILEQFKRLENRLITMADEAHINTMTPILKSLDQSYRIGLTATPYFKYAKHLPEIYKHLVHGPQVEELIQLKKLCDYKHIARTRGDLSLLELRNGEYSEASQDKVFNSTAVYDGLFEDLRTIPFNKAIIFVASIKSADALTESLQGHGFAATCFHSGLANGEYELAKFTELRLANILVTIRSLSKGWDHKPIDLVVLNHKTTSAALYLQEVGRGSRVIDGVKHFFTVLDYGDNWKQHGLYFENRDFTKLWNQSPKKKRDGEGVAPVKLCPKCDSLLSASVRVCQYCGEEFPIVEKELEIGDLVEITQDYSELAGKRLSELSPYQLSVYVKTLNKKPFGARVARAREQEVAGFLHEYAGFMGYKTTWVDFQMSMIGDEKIEFADLVIRGTVKAA
ncbi:MAG TPA: DEAD/DEAH box helicase family protein [Sphingobacteriaceae bacterium]